MTLHEVIEHRRRINIMLHHILAQKELHNIGATTEVIDLLDDGPQNFITSMSRYVLIQLYPIRCSGFSTYTWVSFIKKVISGLEDLGITTDFVVDYHRSRSSLNEFILRGETL